MSRRRLTHQFAMNFVRLRLSGRLPRSQRATEKVVNTGILEEVKIIVPFGLKMYNFVAYERISMKDDKLCRESSDELKRTSI